MEDRMTRIARKISKGEKTVFFTGAGISTESGISDYRGKGGLWEKFQPVYFDDFMNSRDARVEYWRQRAIMHPQLVNAKPNAAHEAIKELYDMGHVSSVITQNIDGLHQASGLPEEAVIELHGNTRRIRCMSCGAISGENEAYKRIKAGDPAPECSCGGYLKPDTVSFGQSMPTDKVERARELSVASDVFVVVGSTLLVQPASLMPYYAKESKAFLVIVNLSETACDSMCDVLIRGKAGESLGAIVSEVQKL